MKQLLITIAAITLFSCVKSKNVKMETQKEMVREQTSNMRPPLVRDYVNSPLRNKIRLSLNASVSEVWSLVGKLERMPEYSSGLKDLKAEYDDNANCISYTCYFFPMEAGGAVTTHSETIKWYQSQIGYISLAQEPNILGLEQCLSRVTLEALENNTILQWETYFSAESKELIKMNIIGFEQALNQDIAQNLIKIFGGEVLESFVGKL